MELVELNSLNRTQQHRERAVDVPESFVAIVKQTPRYPPPQKNLDRTDSSKDSLKLNYNNFSVKQNNQININNNKVGYEPEKLRKYSEEINKKKKAEEEFIRSSLRNSIKPNRKLLNNNNLRDIDLKNLKNAVVNNAFENDDYSFKETILPDFNSILKQVSNSFNNQEFNELIEKTNFSYFLSIYNILVENSQKINLQNNSISSLPFINSVELLRDIILVLQFKSNISSEEAELLKILTKLKLELLCGAFDKILESHRIFNEFEIDNQHNDKVLNSERILYNNRLNDNIRVVYLKKTNCESLGITILNDLDGSVIIGRIVKGGSADKCGLLNEGDEIIEINGIELRGRNVNQICDMLSEINGTLTFILATRETSRINNMRNTQTFVHFRALFNYDPEEDIYIPCRELGICFNKGDIIHVIDQSDQNWWQAYKEGDQEHSLAGLVPSIYFQIQRESMKKSLNESESGSFKSKKSLLCKGKKKKKKNINLELQDEILTYEEVHLYYPKANIKRPIVLIGPTNIGRHELRQRIMLDSERFAAAVPHTSRNRRDGEMDGVDYHFISRNEFELYIRQGKFVEHGQYEGNFYGTSLGAIEAVVQSGKICLLNLHVHSIHILRQSPAGTKLKPYFIFVAPPLQLDKLNKLITMTNIHSSETGSLSSKDLQFIIKEAEEIESRYGHYFDMVLSMTDIDKAYYELLKEINTLERESQWIPKVWIK